MTRFLVIAALLLTAMLNWSMTCCCGESMFVEIVRGSCLAHHEDDEHHEHGHAGSHHTGKHQHSCHKSLGSSFVPTSSFAGPSELLVAPVLAADLDLPAPGDSARLLAEFACRCTPGVPPPDIPLLTQSLLI